MKEKFVLPELLSPAGSIAALEAAVEGGADAVYIGGASFNARINAKNFTREDICEAVRLCHRYGVKLYQTLNTMLYDRELDAFLRDAYSSAEAGVDAFIVSDLGAASLLRKYIPDVDLHASTQASVHSSDGARELERLGFTRLVPARELSLENIKNLVNNTSLEVEIFIHGALCVSHSGQCLFSSLVGGRSGNRGLCAQPCRLPYCAADISERGERYPLSLKDLSLCSHVEEIIDSGVSSLKIEGRMKSPEYVYTVTRIWRELLDAKRSATGEELSALYGAFSRGGFTDGYFTERINKKMLGVRSDEDKSVSRELEKFSGISRKIPIDVAARVIEGEPMSLTLTCKDISVVATGDVAQAAINAPLDSERVKTSLSKLGDTPYIIKNIDIELSEKTMVPISRLNSLRRDAVSLLDAAILGNSEREFGAPPEYIPRKRRRIKNRSAVNEARFLFPEQISERARSFFDTVYLPLERYTSDADGFIMPAVVFDSEREEVIEKMRRAVGMGAERCIISNIGQIAMAKEVGVEFSGDFRFNAANGETLSELKNLGLSSVILSPETTLPQIRDIDGDFSVIVYGKIPLMTLEKCIIRDLWGCERCENVSPDRMTYLRDRRGAEFAVARDFRHRNIIYNSLPTSMSDRQDALAEAGVSKRHFIFTDESRASVDRVIEEFENSLSPTGTVRRI